MLHTFIDSACMLIGSILGYLSLRDPHEDFTEADRVQFGDHTVPVIKLLKRAFGFLALVELYLNLIPQSPYSYLIPLPEILQRPFPRLFSTSEPSLNLSNLRPLFRLVFLICGAFRVWSMHTLGHLFTFTLSIRKGHKLIAHGPYAFVRHPSYTGLCGLIASGVFIVATSELTERLVGLRTIVVRTGWLGGLGVVIMAYLGIFLFHHWALGLRVKNEEEMLEREFGEEWMSYKRKVPYKIFPFIW